MYLPLVGCSIAISVLFLLIMKSLARFYIVMIVLIMGLCALTYARNEVWRSEISLWQDVVKKSPSKARGYYNLGLVLDEKGDYDAAASFYKKAIQADPRHVLVQNGTQSLDSHKVNFPQTITDSVLAWMNLGVLDTRKGHYLEAIRKFKRAIALAPLYAPAHDNLASAYYRVGDFKNALASFKTALEIDPNYSAVYDHVGIFLNEQGKSKEASAYFRKALSVNPADTEAVFQLGRAAVQLHEFDSARQWVFKLKNLGQSSRAQELEQLIVG
jgi:tetratricopeptide (TPR) repeat protein